MAGDLHRRWDSERDREDRACALVSLPDKHGKGHPPQGWPSFIFSFSSFRIEKPNTSA